MHRTRCCAPAGGRCVLRTRWGAALPKPLARQQKRNTRFASVPFPLACYPQQKEGQTIAIFHCPIQIIKRSTGKSAVAAAAYRSGEKLVNEWDGMIHDYTKKGGVIHTEIMLPVHAPPEFSDRSALWNSVEKIEKSSNAQLAREIEVALAGALLTLCFLLRQSGRISQSESAAGAFKYRIGTIILHWNADAKVFDIVDGQQRIISLLLIRRYLTSGKRADKFIQLNLSNKETQANLSGNFAFIADWFSAPSGQKSESLPGQISTWLRCRP